MSASPKIRMQTGGRASWFHASEERHVAFSQSRQFENFLSKKGSRSPRLQVSSPPTPSPRKETGFRFPIPTLGEGVRGWGHGQPARSLIHGTIPVNGYKISSSKPSLPHMATSKHEKQRPTSQEDGGAPERPNISKVFGRGSGGQPFFKRVSPGNPNSSPVPGRSPRAWSSSPCPRRPWSTPPTENGEPS